MVGSIKLKWKKNGQENRERLGKYEEDAQTKVLILQL